MLRIAPVPCATMRPSAACVSRTSVSTFNRTSRSSRSMSRDVKLPYVPIPALFTRMSTGSSTEWSRASTATRSVASRRSATCGTAFTCVEALSSPPNASRRALSRATSTRSSPLRANATANARPMPDVAPVTRTLLIAPSRGEVERSRDGVDRGVDGLTDVHLADRPLRVLQPVAGDRAHRNVLRAYQSLSRRLEQACDGCRRRRLDEATLFGGEESVRVEDLCIGDGSDVTIRGIARFERARPRRRVPDPDRGGDRLGVRHGLAQHDRRRAGRLPAEHPGQATRAPEGVVLAIAAPPGGDVAGVPDREAVHGGRVAQHVDDLE